MKKEINLEDIILKAYGCKDIAEFRRENDISIQMIKEICFEACNQVLDLAAENAEGYYPQEPVSKDSILQIKDWIK